MAVVLLALAAALLVPRPSAHGATVAATTLGPGFALASPGAGSGSASPAAGGASAVAPGPERPTPREPEPVMVDAPRRRFTGLRRCDVGYSWVRGLCRRIFGSDSTTLAA